MSDTQTPSKTYAPYPAAAIGNEFISRADRNLFPDELMNFVFLAHGWYLATTNQPLINEKAHAWPWGPVFLTLQENLAVYQHPMNKMSKIKGLLQIERDDGPSGDIDVFDPADVFGFYTPYIQPDDQPARVVLDYVWEKYREFSQEELNRLTTQEGSPWAKTVNQFILKHQVDLDRSWSRNIVIDDEIIRAFFLRLWNEQKHG